MSFNRCAFARCVFSVAIAAAAVSANAEVSVSVGVGGPVYYEPAPVYQSPPPVYYQPAPPVYYQQPPTYYVPPAPAYYPPAPGYYRPAPAYPPPGYYPRDEWHGRAPPQERPRLSDMQQRALDNCSLLAPREQPRCRATVMSTTR